MRRSLTTVLVAATITTSLVGCSPSSPDQTPVPTVTVTVPATVAPLTSQEPPSRAITPSRVPTPSPATNAPQGRSQSLLGYRDGWLVRVGDRKIDPPRSNGSGLLPPKVWWNDCVRRNGRSTCVSRWNAKIGAAVDKALPHPVPSKKKPNKGYCDIDSPGDCADTDTLKNYTGEPSS